MKKIDTIKPLKITDSKNFNFGIGMEKLDRDCFNADLVYDDVSKIGAKWVRIQSGWSKTEKQKGVYDFTWLEKIVDNLLKRGMEPWICLCYGNELYDSTAINKTGGIGRPPIFSKDAQQAWKNYVKATVEYFKGKVSYYEIWNEPDGSWCWKHGVNGREYGKFAVDTANAIKETNIDVKIIGGSFCWGNMLWLAEALQEGMGDVVDYITYHNYYVDVETNGEDTFNNIKALLKSYGSTAGIIQGETGCNSNKIGKGALSGHEWTEEKQAKFLLRLLTSDLKNGVYFSSWFSAVDMYENLSGSDAERTINQYGFFGLLREEFNGIYPTGKYSPKPSYKAMQNMCSVFNCKVEPTFLPISFEKDKHSGKTPMSTSFAYPVKRADFNLENGKKVFAYWKTTDIATQSFDSVINVFIANMKKPKLADLLTGEVFELDSEIMGDPTIWSGESLAKINQEISEKYGMWNLKLPLKDYPLFLIFD